MKLIRFGEPGKEKPGALMKDGTRIDASGFGSDYNEAFLNGGGLKQLDSWLQKNASSAPKVAPRCGWDRPSPGPARSSVSDSTIAITRQRRNPRCRKSPSSSLRRPRLWWDRTILWYGPRDSTKVDWEVELAVVIGKQALYVSKENALDHVAGYALHNDYSERNFQLEHGGQWVKGKSADTFAPLGPFLATPDEIPSVGNLKMWLKVNGTMRQNSSTANMIFDVPTLVSYVSQFMTLLPGDVISTGTPAGVGLGMNPPVYLNAGDVVELGIEGLGESRQEVKEYK